MTRCSTVAVNRLGCASEPIYQFPSFTCKLPHFTSGAEGIRTPDLRRAKAALSQLSYGPR
jgi:hypothetical protein